MNNKKIEEAFRALFTVWHGTENADEILQDAVRTIGHRVFDMSSCELNKFEKRCRGSCDNR
jgi:hypothetical protein